MEKEGVDSNVALALAGEKVPSGPLAPLETEVVAPVDPRGQLFFSRYQEDGTLRLYKKDSLIGDTPAGYADEEVAVKIMVVTKSERFMVVLAVRRQQLAHPGIEAWLAEQAWGHR